MTSPFFVIPDICEAEGEDPKSLPVPKQPPTLDNIRRPPSVFVAATRVFPVQSTRQNTEKLHPKTYSYLH